MQTLLVFGGDGQIGRALALQGAKSGRNIRSLSRSDVDITDVSAATRAIVREEPGCVVNCAGYTDVDRAEAEPGEARRINADAPGNLAKICAEHRIPFVHLSTDYVFDGTSVRYSETDIPAPLNVYGRTKLGGEAAVHAAGGRSLILRTSWVFSPWGQNFVHKILSRARSGGPLQVVDDEIGGPTAAVDVADAILGIVSKLHGSSDPNAVGVFHYQGQPAVSRAGFAEAILKAATSNGWPEVPFRKVASSAMPTPVHRPARAVLDCTKIARVYGISRPDWRPTLETTVAKLLSGAG